MLFSKKYFSTWLLGIICFFQIENSSAQFYNGMQMNFGKNRIQYQEFNWMYYRSDRCDVYFYPKGKQIAQYVLKYGSAVIEQMEQKIGGALENKIQFIIYTNFNDFRESNIGLIGEDMYNTGGVNYISGNKVFLYFDKGYRDLDRMMMGGVASVIIREMLYGGSVFSKVKNQTILNIPDWFIDGLLSFYSENWSFELDNYYRDMIINGKADDITKLKGKESIVAGHAFWKFISDKYSDRSVASVLNMTKNIRNFERAVLYSLGSSFDNLYAACLVYYKNRYEIDVNRDAPIENFAIKTKKNRIYSQYSVSNSKGHVAYVTNQEGQEKIWVIKSGQKKAKRIYKQHHKIETNPDKSYPLLAWNSRGNLLGIIRKEKELLYFITYDVDSKELTKKPIINMDKVTSFSYSNDGKYFTFSGIKNGQSDIFVYFLASNSYIPITDDIYDDYGPAFYEGSSKIIFSSNRHVDSTEIKNFPGREILIKPYNLFVFDFINRSKKLFKATNFEFSSQTNPIDIGKNNFIFLSEESGITNRYIGSFDSTISYIDTSVHYSYYAEISPLTNFSTSILEHEFSFSNSKIIDNFYYKGKYQLLTSNYQKKQKGLENIEPTKYRSELGISVNKSPLNSDSVNLVEKPKRKRLAPVKLKDAYKDHPEYIAETGHQAIFILGEDTTRKQVETNTLKPDQVEKSYLVQYLISQIVSQVDFSFLNTSYQQFAGGNFPIYQNAGFNALFMVGTNDLLEDHRIIGGVRFSIDFSDTEFLLSYENLKNRLDKQVLFHRQNSKYIYDLFAVKQTSYTLAYILKWPFSEVSAIRGTALGRFDRKVYLATDLITLKEPNYLGYWSGLKGEYIFDNSRNLSQNILKGTRAKLFAEYYQSVEDENKNLFVLGGDFRNYIKIHKTFIWANRIAASTSFGKNRLIYYMGGVDNWLFPKFNSETSIAQDQNYTYQTLATNMRGFHQNIRNGNSFAVINSELRFPVFQYFRAKPIKSSFIKNFQIITFGDIGTAWTGSNPYSEDNSLFKQIIIRGPIKVTLQKQTDPVVGGYGFGLRSTLFGYFIRADWAWGVEDRKIQPRVFYISLNLDF